MQTLRRTSRSSFRRTPRLVRAAEGTDDGARSELDALAAANVLRQNTVILHGTGLRPEDGARIAAARATVVWCPEADRRLYGTTTPVAALRAAGVRVDRKSTRLNSSHVEISYAVFCLKKKKKYENTVRSEKKKKKKKKK